ncbi:MAG: phosphoribosylamine--glycine ligase [candidate division WOR-3 bacterium]|nr:MAG: phosphoribosylamine--glycine ligase [candidate division WOR-3 bacterium]
MRILVVGGGGREHALVWKLAQHHKTVFCAPGNAGIARTAECVDIKPDNIPGLADFAAETGIDLTVVGPETPLVDGIGDEFARRGLVLFGPMGDGARLEGDKSFAKRLMQEQGIPTARFEVFDDYEKARTYLADQLIPVVVKASGLAAGKGAVVCATREQAEQALRDMMVEARFGRAGSRVVIEQFLEGEEASIIGVCDGKRVATMAASQDHKRLNDGDQGPNTGGMGAYAPAAVVTEGIADAVEEKVFRPLLKGFDRLGIEFRGAVYAGIMLTKDGPFVLEFNCRFGDPETQAVLPLTEGDLGELLLACAQGDLAGRKPVKSDKAAVCVVAASGGYPGSYPKGLPVSGELFGSDDAVVFHAGTRIEAEGIVTSGGRVLGVTGIGADLPEARDRAYAAIGNISFDGMFFRRDIGHRGLARLSAGR